MSVCILSGSVPDTVEFVVGFARDISFLVDEVLIFHRREQSDKLSYAITLSGMGIRPILK